MSRGLPPPLHGRETRRRRGFTLIELVVFLLLTGLLLAAGLPRVASTRDRAAVHGAREAAVGLFSRARVEARAAGGAEIRVEESPSRLVLSSRRRVATVLDLGAEYRVEVEVPGPAGRATLRFDALGIGRVASRTLVFRRGEHEAALAVSSYGRVRRR